MGEVSCFESTRHQQPQ